jgi:hypothetical protein
MKWFWYVAREDELMCDLDSRTLLEIALKRLERSKELQVRSTFVAPSQNDEHYHMVIRLAHPMLTLYRLTWELYFMSHVYRSVKNFFRALDGIPAPSLLISPCKWEIGAAIGQEGVGFWRKPDTACNCESHKNPEKILTCPAHIKLRGRP